MSSDVKKMAPPANEPFRFRGEEKRIELLAQKVIPPMPHLLSVPTTKPYMRELPPWEKHTTPFAPWEVEACQYMSLVPYHDRGVIAARGDWAEEISNLSPSSNSGASTATPHSQGDANKPRKKITLADYKGRRGSTQPPTPAPNVLRVSKAQNVSAEGPEGIKRKSPRHDGDRPSKFQKLYGNSLPHNGIGYQADPHDSTKPDTSLPSKPDTSLPPKPDFRPAQAIPRSNGNGYTGPSHQARTEDRRTSDANRPIPRLPQERRHGRTVSKDSVRDCAPPARSVDSEVARVPQKIARAGPNGTTNGASSANPVSEKSALSNSQKPSVSGRVLQGNAQLPAKPQSTTPTPQKAKTNTYEAREPDAPQESRQNGSQSSSTSKHSKGGPQNELPPLLSPLHRSAWSGNSPDTRLTDREHAKKQSEKSSNMDHPTPPKSPKAGKHQDGQKPVKALDIKTPPKSLSPLDLPPLLSPTLPEPIMRELARLKTQEAKNTGSANSVETRYEKSREPNAPGVAKKTVKSQSTMPAPRRPDTVYSETGHHGDKVDQIEKEPSCIVKLKYKKRQALSIARLLTLPSKGTNNKPDKRTKQKTQEETRDQSLPLSDRKRPRGDSNLREPATKRPKASDSLEPADPRTPATPALKSPLLVTSSSAQKRPSDTPKKNEALKAAAMRKLDSKEGNPHTPQPPVTSTPASAEPAGATTASAPTSAPILTVQEREIASYRSAHTKLTKVATALKREVDRLLQLKPAYKREGKPPTRDEQHVAALKAIECLATYMEAFHALDETRQAEHRPIDGTNWTSLVGLARSFDHLLEVFPKLRALGCGLTALCQREELTASFAATLDTKGVEATRHQFKQTHLSWAEFEKLSRRLSNDVATELLTRFGPWASVNGAAKHAMDILAEFAREMKIEWKKYNDSKPAESKPAIKPEDS